MVLVDTTVWIDYFAAKNMPQVVALERFLHDGEDLCICGVILTEVLQGIRHESDHVRVSFLFESLLFLPMTRVTFVRSADIYRSLRQQGVTIRKPVDCMIAAVAIEHDIPLLHHDRDFEAMASRGLLKVVTPLP
jgi:predicted nucleic acid-binding protein